MNMNLVRDSFQVGDKVEIRLDRGIRKYGTVIGVYDDFILVNRGRFRERYLYVDMWIGEVGIVPQKAA